VWVPSATEKCTTLPPHTQHRNVGPPPGCRSSRGPAGASHAARPIYSRALLALLLWCSCPLVVADRCLSFSFECYFAPADGSSDGPRPCAAAEMADAAAAAPAAGGDKKTPSEFLKNVLGRPVVVKLNSGVDYRGASTSAAGHLPASLSLLAAPPRALLLRSGVRAPTLCRCPSRRRERAR
jgi:hypothetical protein